jgi:hypothetical protein
MIKIAIDIDGVITANPPALSWITYHLSKNENNAYIYILSWRHDNQKRREETIKDLTNFGIFYNELIMCPRKLPNARVAAYWKIRKIKDLGINIWIDDEIKIYQRDYGIKVNDLLPEVIKIWI